MVGFEFGIIQISIGGGTCFTADGGFSAVDWLEGWLVRLLGDGWMD